MVAKRMISASVFPHCPFATKESSAAINNSFASPFFRRLRGDRVLGHWPPAGALAGVAGGDGGSPPEAAGGSGGRTAAASIPEGPVVVVWFGCGSAAAGGWAWEPG